MSNNPDNAKQGGEQPGQTAVQPRDEFEGMIPTPRVGDAVLWYPKGRVDAENAIAAIVTRVEEVGKIAVTVFRPNAMPLYRMGVHFIGHPIAANSRAGAIANSGLWGFQDGDEPQPRHYRLHQETIERQAQAAADHRRVTSAAKKK